MVLSCLVVVLSVPCLGLVLVLVLVFVVALALPLRLSLSCDGLLSLRLSFVLSYLVSVHSLLCVCVSLLSPASGCLCVCVCVDQTHLGTIHKIENVHGAELVHREIFVEFRISVDDIQVSLDSQHPRVLVLLRCALNDQPIPAHREQRQRQRQRQRQCPRHSQRQQDKEFKHT
jgi:hypothetical protein